MAGWLAPVAAWLCCRWPAGCPASSPGTGVFANRVSPASWTGCFFCPRFHLGAPGCPLSRCPLNHPKTGLRVYGEGGAGSGADSGGAARGEARAAAAAGARRASVAGGGSDEAEVEGNAEEHQDSNSKVRWCSGYGVDVPRLLRWSTGRAKQKERPVRVRARNSGSRKAAVGAPGRGKARSSSSANTSRAARRGAAPMLPSGERSPSYGELRLD